jgi:hypothetical protein
MFLQLRLIRHPGELRNPRSAPHTILVGSTFVANGKHCAGSISPPNGHICNGFASAGIETEDAEAFESARELTRELLARYIIEQARQGKLDQCRLRDGSSRLQWKDTAVPQRLTDFTFKVIYRGG